jgi:hypothetical protein
MTRMTISSLTRAALARMWALLPRLSDSWTAARLNPELPPHLLGRLVPVGVIRTASGGTTEHPTGDGNGHAGSR